MNTLDARRRLLGRNVYKRTTEGNPAIAQGSLARRYPGITMQGWTEQPQYEGKNLLLVDVGQSFTGTDVRDSAVFVEDGVTVSYNDILPGERRDIYMFGDGVGLYSESSYVDIPEITPGKYHICNDSARISFYVIVWRNGASVVLGFSTTSTTPITIEEGDKFRIFFACNNPVDGIQEYTIHPMLVKDGGELKTYEPYTGGAPSPSPDYPQEITSAGDYDEGTGKYRYEVNLTGKNLFDLNSSTILHMVSADILDIHGGVQFIFENIRDAYGKLDYKPKRGVKYYIECDIEIVESNNLSQVQANYHPIAVTRDSLNHYISDVLSLIWKSNIAQNKMHLTAEFTTPSDEDCSIYIYGNSFSSNVTGKVNFTNFIISELPAEYEPYRTPQTVTLASDRPLTKWDKLEKRNGQWGWVYKSGSYTVTGEESYYLGTDQYRGKITSNAFIRNNEMISKPDYIEDSDKGYCEHLRLVYNVWANKDGIVGFAYNNGQIHMRINNADTGVTEEDTNTDIANKIKAYCAKRYEEGNPFIFWYETTEETFVPLSEIEQEAMNELYTFRPTTVLSNDQECEMTLTYKTRKSMEVTE